MIRIKGQQNKKYKLCRWDKEKAITARRNHEVENNKIQQKRKFGFMHTLEQREIKQSWPMFIFKCL